MTITSQAQNERKSKKEKTGWDKAIADAKERIKKLELSISVFQERKNAGDPWPGNSATQGKKRETTDVGV